MIFELNNKGFGFLWVGLLIVGGCTDKTSPYNLNCRHSEEHISITDDTLLKLASKVIYDDLKSKGRLDILLSLIHI